MAPKVYLVVLSWNGRRWLEPCLRSVLLTDYSDFQVVVVDNASQDGSADFVRERFPEVEVVVNPCNLGFAGGNNVGIARALDRGARYVVLLNQDTVVQAGWLQALVRVAEGDHGIGILSPFQYDYEGKEIDPVFHNLVRDNTSFFLDQGCEKIVSCYEVPTVIGAAMMLRRELVEQLGALDPIYFAYFEEKDLCRRARAAGYRIALVPGSRIGHWHGQIHADQNPTDVDGLFLRNRQIFILKDPTQSFWKNLYIYLRYGLPGSLARRYDSPQHSPGFWRALGIQAGIFAQLPRIARRRRRDRRRIDACRTQRQEQRSNAEAVPFSKR